MTELEIALGLLTLATSGACAWLLRERFRLAAARDLATERLADRDRDERRVRETFETIAARSLQQSSEHFLQLARESLHERHVAARSDLDERYKAVEQLVKPLGETLQRVEKEREGAYQRLVSECRNLAAGHAALRDETGRLAQALSKPTVRGRYGEIQLERVVELAGMRDYCDFETQSALSGEQGNALRPDMIVRLPNERIVVIDAKTNIEAYIDAQNAPNEEEALRCLGRFAASVAEHMGRLARKEYWSAVEGTAEFTVMFMPGDQLIDAALQQRPDLIERAAQLNVVLASPSTLIGLLRAIHIGWRERRLSDNAQELFRLGRELHERTVTVLERVGDLGTSVEQTRARYNRLVGSIESRMLPSLRKIESHGAKSAKTLPRLPDVEKPVRLLRPPDGDEDECEEPRAPLPRAAGAAVHVDPDVDADADVDVDADVDADSSADAGASDSDPGGRIAREA